MTAREFPVPLLFPDLTDEAYWNKGGSWDIWPHKGETMADALLSALGVTNATHAEQTRAVVEWTGYRSAKAAPAELFDELTYRGLIEVRTSTLESTERG